MPFATVDTITDIAAERWEKGARDPRLGQLMASLIRHLHAFARENELTEGEWFEATEFLSRVGQMSNDKRKEFILLSDTLGLSMLVTLMNNQVGDAATKPTLLGPFYIPDSPEIPFGERLPGIADEDGAPLFVQGRVSDQDGRPLAGAVLDVWQNDQEGIYEAQLIGSDARHRGLVATRADGSYLFRTVAPVDYAIPVDGPVGDLIARTTISEFRPAHIHFIVRADGCKPLTTHVFDSTSPKIESDVVFGTRPELVVDLVDHPAGTAPNGEAVDRPFKVLTLDFVLEGQ
ncbi:dioxygenase [Alteraurantiacibacter aestuarii]|uniref:Catechol 1,2-dioxygenase n=1 Tax=Alteraurantiacibacter aestuarii TaxID=650004 RepID=A0A844ZPZ1_9SPHN|nr:dioxygenase [Alteraurantiacibacter aestuarii]MXO89116.1 catechol 1,2-dioxygenase [Alteraurantiacibacter aestuarii]